MTGTEPDPAAAPAPAETGTPAGSPAWRPLPRAALALFVLGSAFGLAAPAFGLGLAANFLLPGSRGWDGLAAGVAAFVAVGMLVGAWSGYRRWRSTRWLLDGDALRIRRGIWWRSESLVPRSRIQHLDLERGPLERQAGLASLVVYTAGTRMAAVRLPGLALADAERLRDSLVRDSSDDDDAV